MVEKQEQQGYNPLAIEPKWQRYWDENKTFKTTRGRRQTEILCTGYVPLSIRSRSACRSSGRIYGNGYRFPLQDGCEVTMCFTRWVGMLSVCLLSSTRWIQANIRVILRLRISIISVARSNRLASPTIGIARFSTTDPDYYKWTQWIFIQLYNKGLAYVAEVPVNWCPALGTVLANEEVIDGLSERGNHPVVRKPMRQWILRITEYAERLLEDLEELDWSESIKDMQRNWIGKSTGAEVDFCHRWS